MNKAYWLLPLLLVVACSKVPADGDVREIIVSSKDPVHLKFSDFFNTLKIVPLETNEGALIGRIDKVMVTDQGIFVLDRKIAESLFLFDHDGTLLQAFVGTGDGPGEYIRVSDFDWNPERKTVLIRDNSILKALEVTLEGEVVSEMKMGEHAFYYDFFPITNGYLTMAENQNGEGIVLGLIDSNWKSSGSGIAIQNQIPNILGNPKYEYFYQDKNGGVLFKEPLKNQVYRFHKDSGLEELSFVFQSNEWDPPAGELTAQEAYRHLWESEGLTLADQVQEMDEILLINCWKGADLGMIKYDEKSGEANLVETWENDLDGIVKKIPGLMPSNTQPNVLILDFLPTDLASLVAEVEKENDYVKIAREVIADRDGNPVLFIYSKE